MTAQEQAPEHRNPLDRRFHVGTRHGAPQMTAQEQAPERRNPAALVARRDRETWSPVKAEIATDPEPERDTSAMLTGRMVSLRFIRAALRRSRRIWLTAAALGLLVGAGYHVVVPLKHVATSTVYLVHPSGSGVTPMETDVSLLETPAVGKRAIALLGPQARGLRWSSLLGKAPATISSSNILVISIYGASADQAVLRVNAVANAFLAFRAQQYDAQNAAEVAGTRDQIARLKSEVTKLTVEIASLTANGTTQGITSLESERATATTEIASLQGAIQQDDITTLAATRGSRIITPGTAVPISRKKTLALDGLMGLVGGLGAGMLGVILYAVLSDRLRRREDVAAVLGAPIGISIGKVRRRILRRSIVAMASAPSRDLKVFEQYLRSLVLTKPSPGALVVALDDLEVPAAGLLALSRSLAREGKRVVLVDASDSRAMARALGPPDLQSGRADSRVTLLVPSRPWEGEVEDRWPYSDHASEPDAQGPYNLAVETGVETFLVLATVEPRVGAWHLLRWGSEAIVTVSAGSCSAHKIAVAAELLEAAGLTVVSSILMNADADDESIGLPNPGKARHGSYLGLVRQARALSK
jgi:hypothetical protein